LKIFSGLLKLATNDLAYAYRKVYEWVRIIEENEAKYMEAQMSDRLLFIRINFTVHSRLQIYIRNCRQTKDWDLEPELLDFSNMHRFLLVEGCRANLPEVIMREIKVSDKKRPRFEYENAGDRYQEEKPRNPKSARGDKGDPVFLAEHNVNPRLLIRDGETFGDLADAIRKLLIVYR